MRVELLIYTFLISTLSCCTSEMNKIPQNIDHLVYTAPTLDEGIDAIEKILGVRAIIGGKHAQYGTHNALLSLGDSIYLEIIAPDPNLESPMDGRLLEDSYSKKPKLTTWVLREDNIGEN